MDPLAADVDQRRPGGQQVQQRHHPLGEHGRQGFHTLHGGAVREVTENIGDVGVLLLQSPGALTHLGRQEQFPADRDL